MINSLGFWDIVVLGLYGLTLVGMGIYYSRKCKTANQFMVADQSIPAWAAGLAVMSAYTSSISYIASPGKAFDDNWQEMVFALCIFPVVWLVCRYVIPYYRKSKIISVYGYLEEKLGIWARAYAGFSFILYMVGRMAVILYLAGLLLTSFVSWDIETVIVVIGVITIFYTLMGGMEAVVWTDVMQSAVMIFGVLFCTAMLSVQVFSHPEFEFSTLVEQGKFSFGSLDFSLASRTILVLVIYSVTENLRNLIADQNYVQKYTSVGTEEEAKQSVWVAMLIYIPMKALFLYVGTMLFAFYTMGIETLPGDITKGDQVFPYYIATQLPTVLKGLLIAAIMAAAMSTIDSALNCSATVLLLDFWKRLVNPNVSEEHSIFFLRMSTVVWGILGTGFALLMIKAQSALDIWWQISGIFGGGILGLFLLALFGVRLQLWQGITAIATSILIISWGTFARNLPEAYQWMECTIDSILIGAVGTAAMIAVALLLHLLNWGKKVQPS